MPLILPYESTIDDIEYSWLIFKDRTKMILIEEPIKQIGNIYKKRKGKLSINAKNRKENEENIDSSQKHDQNNYNVCRNYDKWQAVVRFSVVRRSGKVSEQ